MRRRSSKRSPELKDLQFAFWLDVVKAGDEYGPDQPCHLAAYDDRDCSGFIRACHWINRQRIRNDLWKYGVDPDLIVLAEWDPRLAVPGCTEHHPRFDTHLVPLPSERLWVFREEVPWEVEAAVSDWGLETALEDRSPFFDPRVSVDRNTSERPEHVRLRESIAAERKLFGA